MFSPDGTLISASAAPHCGVSKDWIDNGIVLIRQLLGCHSEYLNFNDFTNQFPHIKMYFLVYGGIITAIKKYQKKVDVKLSVRFSCLNT